MKKIEEVTCIKFEDRSVKYAVNHHQEQVTQVGFSFFALEKTSNKDFIEFRGGGDCHSYAGRQGGSQEIVLASYCAEEHTLVHEVYIVNEAIITQ